MPSASSAHLGMMPPSMEEGGRQMLVFSVPDLDDLGSLIYMQSTIVMKRQGGFLLAVPSAGISEELIDHLSQEEESGQEPLLGPHHRLLMTVMIPAEEGGEDIEFQEPVDLTLLDVSMPQASTMLSLYQPDHAGHQRATPFLDGLLEAIGQLATFSTRRGMATWVPFATAVLCCQSCWNRLAWTTTIGVWLGCWVFWRILLMRCG